VRSSVHCRRNSRKENSLNPKNKVLLITGATRGIGQALVDEALKRDADRVYAGTRQPFVHRDERVTPITLDVTNAERAILDGLE
jgi:NAD(P)-dependent dehydrogenase (short-subunit alcohol dehydrogenase family)